MCTGFELPWKVIMLPKFGCSILSIHNAISATNEYSTISSENRCGILRAQTEWNYQRLEMAELQPMLQDEKHKTGDVDNTTSDPVVQGQNSTSQAITTLGNVEKLTAEDSGSDVRSQTQVCDKLHQVNVALSCCCNICSLICFLEHCVHH